jgi:hypothetical protein
MVAFIIKRLNTVLLMMTKQRLLSPHLQLTRKRPASWKKIRKTNRSPMWLAKTVIGQAIQNPTVGPKVEARKAKALDRKRRAKQMRPSSWSQTMTIVNFLHSLARWTTSL